MQSTLISRPEGRATERPYTILGTPLVRVWSAAFLILADLNSSAQLVKLTEMNKPWKSLAKGDCNWASGFRPANRALKLNCRFTVPQLQNESAEVSDPR